MESSANLAMLKDWKLNRGKERERARRRRREFTDQQSRMPVTVFLR